jgi:hypothetical protein
MFDEADIAKISPKLAFDRLKLVVLELAILFEAIASSAAAAFKPVSEV